jgi:hypothetical protein
MKNAIELFSSTPSLLKIGSGEIKKIYVGNKDVTSMYIGNTLIYGLGDTPNIPTEQPVMDGLVYWMDALSLNYGDNTWNNKVGSGAFAFNDFTYDDTSENGILFSSEKQTLLTSNFTINKGVNEPLSIELFLKITSIGSDNDWAMSIDGWQNGFLLGILGDAYALSGNKTAVLNTGVKVVTNEKTQLCIVFNTDNTYSFYINGRFVSSWRTNADFSINNKNIVLGGTSTEHPQDCMDGYIYSFRLYNRILTAEEVMENYEYELLPKEELPPEEELSPITDGLTCWLDARSLNSFALGETWADLSGNGNNGSIALASLTSLENGILDGSGYINIPNPTKGLSNYTVEVGFKDLSMGYWLGLWGNTAGSTGNSAYKQNGAYSGYPVPMAVTVSKTEREYCTIVVKDNRVDIYLNGLLLRENCCTLTPSDAKYFVFMGRKPNAPTQDTDGVADAKRAEWYFLRIYDRALTGDEISFNYTYETSINRGMPNVEEVKPIVPPITPEPIKPIMDGLTCWLDGADLTNGDTVWNDRTNNQNNFQLYNTSSFSCNGKGLKNNNNGYATLSKAITFNEYTIEIKHRRYSWQTNSLLFNAKRSGNSYDIILGYTYSSFYQCYSNSNPKHYEISKDVVPLNKDVTLTWVVRASERKLYIDGVYCASNNSSSGHQSVDIASIDLFKYNNVYCNATIYSIKIYNRALSEDEIQKNAEYEDTIDRS